MTTSIAFLLSVYSNVRQANMFIRQLLRYQFAEVFVHFDSKLAHTEREQLIKNRHVHITPQSFDVSWGEYSQIKVYNYLFNYAQQYADFDYYSLNSGADLLLCPIENFVKWLDDNQWFACYNCQPLPKYWQYRGGFGRIELYWPKCFLRRLSDHHPLRYLRTLYGMLYDKHIINGRTLPKQYKYYGGNDWFTLSGRCVTKMLDFIKQHTDFDHLFHHSYIGTEIYYVSVFEMIRKNEKVISDNNLRFVDWENRGQIKNAGSPNIITMACYNKMMHDMQHDLRFFARKFDYRVDQQVVDKVLEQTT